MPVHLDMEDSNWPRLRPSSRRLWSAEPGLGLLHETPGVPLHLNEELIASGAFLDNVDASAPRGSAFMQQIQALGISSPHLTEQNIELLRLSGNPAHTEEAQGQPEYTTRGSPSGTKGTFTNQPSYGTDEWEKRKPEIDNLYRTQGLSLSKVKTKMAENGFNASLVINPL